MSFKMLIMHQLNPCSNIPPWAFELVKVGLFKFPPCEAKIVFKCTSQFLVKGKISGHYFLHWPHFKTETLFFGGCLETKIKYLPLNTSILKDTDNLLYSTGCIWQFRGQSILTPRLCENPTTPNFVAQYTAMDCPTGKMPVKWKGFLCIRTIEKMCCLQLTYKFVPEITAAWSSWGKKFQHIQQGRAFNLNYSQLAGGSTHQCQLADV